jgi:phage terminase large subunit-like protein
MSWLSFDTWEACGFVKYDTKELKGRKCYGGLDLSSTQDISAACLSFTPINEGEPFKHIYKFYIPEVLIQEKEELDKVPYRLWIEQGFITATPGNVIDYDWIEADILKDAAEYDIQEYCYDPFHAQELVNHLTDAGITMFPIQQGYRMMAPMCSNFEKKVLSKEMAHNNNPVMRWMNSCMEMKSDRQGNVMPMKPKRYSNGKRIDGMIANIMALGRASIQTPAAGSVYDQRGVIIL